MSSITGLCCPQCRRPVQWDGNEFRPFCSERCRLIDLGAWADESYRLPDSHPEPVADNDDKIN